MYTDQGKLPGVTQLVIRLRGQLLFHKGVDSYFPPLLNDIII